MLGRKEQAGIPQNSNSITGEETAILGALLVCSLAE
jgi:hypothetical protein